jgi:hypothetical protein
MMKKFLFIFFIFISSFVVAQSVDTTLISLSVKDLPFSDFINLIEKESNLKVIYRTDWFDDLKVTTTVNRKDIVDVIKQIIPGNDFSVIKWNGMVLILDKFEFIQKLPNYNEITPATEELISSESKASTEYIKGRKVDLIKIKIGNPKYQKLGVPIKIKGSVVDAATGESIEGATIYLIDINKGAVSDLNGNFDLILPSGKYATQVECLGKKKLNCQLEVLSEGSFIIELESINYEIQEVQIFGDKQMNLIEKEPGLEKLNVKVIKELPTMMGESDIVKVSEMLPGVVSVGEGAAGINVRGGNFDQNAFYFNKIAIYNTSHMFGFFPAFNADVINDFSLYKGYIPAKYGGRLSSVFDINARTGNKKNYTAHGSIGTLAANLTVEGPIKKDTASFLVNFRSSYSDWILKQINDYNIKNSEAKFNDLTVSLDYDLPNTQVNVFGYFSKDYFKFSDLNTYWYSNAGLSTSIGHIFTSSFRGDFSLSASQYEFKTIDTQIENVEYEHQFKVEQYEFSADFRKDFSRKNNLNFGVNSTWFQLNRGQVLPYGENSSQSPIDLGNEQGFETGFYISENVEITPLLHATAGFRFSFYAPFGPETVYTYFEDGPKEIRTINDSIYFPSGKPITWYTFPEFRLALNYQTDENGSLKLSFNQTHQSIFMLSQTISLAPNTQWKLADYHLKPSRANQVSLGVFRTVPKGKWEFSTELFYKIANDYTEFKDGADFLSTPLTETTVLQGDLTSYGVEVLVKKSWPKMNIWFAYTFSRSLVKVDGQNDWDKINNGQAFPSNFDIPNVVNAILTYHFTKRVLFSTTVTYQTGKPATFPTSFYYIDGIPHIDYSDRNEFRIPNYFRTDISLSIEGNLKKEKFLHSTLNFSVYNLTGRKNPYSVYFEEQYGRINGFQYSVIGVPVFMVTWLFKLGNYDAN